MIKFYMYVYISTAQWNGASGSTHYAQFRVTEFRLETQIAQDPGNCLIPGLAGKGLSSDIAVPLYTTIEVIQINYKLLLKVV